MAYIYKHIRKDTNEVFYIGIGSDDEYKRAKSTFGRNIYWKRIVSKYDFYYEIIKDNISWEEACELERYWIKYYGRYNLNEGNLVNMTDGGEGTIGMIFTDEYRSKLSNSAKIRGGNFNIKHSAESKEKMSIAHKNISIETRQKMSKAQSGRTLSEETKQKMSKSRMGRVVTEETKQKIREGNIKAKRKQK